MRAPPSAWNSRGRKSRAPGTFSLSPPRKAPPHKKSLHRGHPLSHSLTHSLTHPSYRDRFISLSPPPPLHPFPPLRKFLIPPSVSEPRGGAPLLQRLLLFLPTLCAAFFSSVLEHRIPPQTPSPIPPPPFLAQLVLQCQDSQKSMQKRPTKQVKETYNYWQLGNKR